MKNLTGLWGQNHDSLCVLLTGLSPKMQIACNEDYQRALWIFGHMLHSRRTFCQEIDVPLAAPECDHWFRSGTAAADVPQNLSLKALLIEWQKMHDTLMTFLNTTPSSHFNRASDKSYPSVQRNLAGTMHYYCMHETYHLGQLSQIIQSSQAAKAVGSQSCCFE